MKKLIGHDCGSYTFNPALGQITFIGLPAIEEEQLLLITDEATNTILYNFADPTAAGTLTGNTLQLTQNTTSLSATDPLQIYIDLPTDSIQLMSTTYSTLGYSPTGYDIGPIDTSGCNSLVMQLSGIWEGSLQVLSSNDAINWVLVRTTPVDDVGFLETISSNGIYVIKAIAKYVAVNMLMLVAGAINVNVVGRTSQGISSADNLGLTLDPNTGISVSTSIINLRQDSNNALILSDAPKPITINNNLNTQTIVDTLGYATLDLTNNTNFAATLSASNDGLVWTNYNGAWVLAGTASGPQSNISAVTGFQWVIPCAARYLKFTVTAVGTTPAIGYLRTTATQPSYVTQSSSVDRLNSVAIVSTGQAGTLPVGGTASPGTGPGTIYPNVIAGVDTSVTTVGVANPLVRRVVTDTTGRVSVGIFGVDPQGIVRNIGASTPAANEYNASALLVQDITTYEGQNAPELLSQVLLELKIMNQYLYDLQRQLRQGPGFASDEPNAFRSDPSIFSN